MSWQRKHSGMSAPHGWHHLQPTAVSRPERGYRADGTIQVLPSMWKAFSNHQAWPCCHASDSKHKASFICSRPTVLWLHPHPISHRPQLGHFPCSMVWPMVAQEPPKITTHACKIAGWGKAALQVTSHDTTITKATYTGMREAHQCGQTWRTWERTARRLSSHSPWASSNESLHQGVKKNDPWVKTKGGRQGMQVGHWHGSCHNEGWWQYCISRPFGTTGNTLTDKVVRERK